MLRYLFEGGSWLAVRPSGTEPKMKIYLGATSTSEQACSDVLKVMNDGIGRLMPR